MPPKKSTGMIKWDEQLAAEAQIAASMEASTGGGSFFSMKGGLLSFQGAPVPGNEMAVVILDSILENKYYEGAFDPENPQGPKCYAFGRDENAMAPHADVVAASNGQCERCADCPMNEFGTAEQGKGKACKNGRRLALIPAGLIDPKSGRFNMESDPEHFASAELAFMSVPPTSIKGYATFVKQVAGSLRRPPWGIVTKVRVIPDNKSFFKVVFEPLETLPDAVMPQVAKRNKEAKELIEFPYPAFEAEQAPAAANKRRPAGPAPKRQGPASIPTQRPTPRPAPAPARAVGGGRKY